DMETAIKTADQKIKEYLKEEYGE
ncbi:MAG: hypothetical protein PWQ80_1145, partial [Thermotoga sp.]|nr:hypothetical protein [Thermotoga sp.]